MIIGVNARFLLKDKLEGIGWYSFETLKRITRQHPEHTFHFFFDRPFDQSFIFSDNIIPHVIQPPARHPVLWWLWFEWSIPHILNKIDADLFLSPDGFCSLRTDVAQVMVIHDLAFEHFPEYAPKWTLKYYKHYTPLYAQKATRIVTVSEYTRQDIAKEYGVAIGKIDLTYNAASDQFKELSEANRAAIRNRFTDGVPYFIYAGAIQPRKNVARLFHAFDRFKSETNYPHKLVVAGRMAWKTGEAQAAYEAMHNKSEVIFTGHLGREDLASVMGAAEALLYVSLFEGFGIPIVEAFQCNVPVVTSASSSMPEVAGQGGIIVNPLDISEITQAMKNILDPATRQNLLQAAAIQARKFSWDYTASSLWESIEKALPKR